MASNNEPEEAMLLKEEVDALGDELGSLEAELQAELEALELESDDGEPEEEPKKEGDLVDDCAVGEVGGGSAEIGVGCCMDAGEELEDWTVLPSGAEFDEEGVAQEATFVFDAQPEHITELSQEARAWLTTVIAAGSTGGDLLDRILSVLREILDRGGTQEEFQAAGLVEVFRDDPSADMPDATHLREALRYLFQNAPCLAWLCNAASASARGKVQEPKYKQSQAEAAGQAVGDASDEEGQNCGIDFAEMD